MKRKTYGLLFAVLCLLSFFPLTAPASPSLATVNKITTQPGMSNTRVILETDSPLLPARTYYAAKTIVVEFDGVIAGAQSLRSASGSPLVTGVSLESAGAEKARLLIQVREPVPYTVLVEPSRTIVELNAIRRGTGEYVIEPEVQLRLERSGSAAAFMNKLELEERDGEVHFRAKLSDGIVSQVFTLENPLRLVVDVFNAVYEEPSSVLPVEKFGLKKARVAQFELSNPRSITRLVFDLKEPKYYELRSSESELVVSFFKNENPVLTAAAGPTAQKTAAPPPPPSAPAVKDPPPKQATSKSQVQAEPKNGPAKEENEKNGKATAAASPAKPLTGRQAGPGQEEPQEQRYQSKTVAQEQVKYTGEIITLKFKDADLRDVILYLGDFAKLNVVFDPDVRGVVTCNLEDVPWDQALDVLLKQHKLGKVLEGNILRIAPISVLTREDEEQRKLRESKELAGPVIVKTFPLSYSKARDVMGLLNTKKSERGQITVDERTNILIITDVKESLDLLERLISVLDTPTPQVSIEARIVEATSTFIRNLGIQWGWRGVADPFYGNQTSIQFPNKILLDGAQIPQGIVTKGIGGPLGGYAINLPAPAFSTVAGFSFANILDTFRLDMAISALETAGEGRIISSPKVTTQNNQAAEIVQGRQIPVQTVANFTVTTRYVNAALELKATPQITAEGTIIMTLELNNNAADFANLVNGIPPITTQSAKTTVMIPDGGTTVIGGIYRTEDSITRERVPFFWSIPIIGNLFRSFARTKQNRELLIFITPRIIK